MSETLLLQKFTPGEEKPSRGIHVVVQKRTRLPFTGEQKYRLKAAVTRTDQNGEVQ